MFLAPATPFPLRQRHPFYRQLSAPPECRRDPILCPGNISASFASSFAGQLSSYIIGDKAPPEVISLADEEYCRHRASSPMLARYFDTIKLSVAPLRFGAGVKGKINHSMGYGVPVVATSVAVEGMSLTTETDAMIADDATSLAAAVVRLYQSEELWTRLSCNGLAKTKELFSEKAAFLQLARIFGSNELAPSATGQTSLGPLIAPARIPESSRAAISP